VLLLVPSLQARDTAVLRNGFSISHDHRAQHGLSTRLFLSVTEDEYVDVPTEDIASIEKEEPAVPAISPRAREVSPDSPVRSADWDRMIDKAASDNQLDADFMRAVIQLESGGHVEAVSRKGAQGLMQLMPKTAAALGVKNSFDANENVGAGAKYLRELLGRYHNDPVKALAAYNAGTGRVQQYHGIPPYAETRAYVAGVIRDFNRRKLGQRAAAGALKSKRRPSSASSSPGGQ
jgi:hypothetical protein